MASKKPSPKQSSAKVKAGIKKLKAAGLYSGDVRKEPTRYAKSLVKEYADVIAGRARVVSIPRVTQGRKNKGIVAAREKAQELADEFGKTIRARKGKIIVRTARPDERVFYSRELDTVLTRYKDTLGKTRTHEYLRLQEKIEEAMESGEPLDEALELPPLKDGQSYALPFSRGKDGIHYEYRATQKEIMDEVFKYESKGYLNALSHVQLVYAGRRRNPKPKKPKTPRKRKSAKKPSNVVPFKRK